MSASYAELSRVAYETGRKFAEVLAETSRPVVQYDAGLNSRPLCFLHVPKMGGASMIHALDSMFDEAEICPARIFSEFDRLTPAQLSKYKFFRGHLQGCQLQALPSETELFTVLRSPAAYARSMYDFLRQLNPSDWRDAWLNLPGNVAEIRAYADEQAFKDMFAEAVNLCSELDLPDVLDEERLLFTIVFADVFLRMLSPEQLLSLKELLSPAQYAHAKQSRFAPAAPRTAELLAGALVVGDQARLDIALYALCERRGWPAPPPLPRIHDYGAKSQETTQENAVAAKVRSISPYDEGLYAIARERARADEDRLLAAAGARAAIPNYLNARFSDRFFGEAKPVLSFDLGADRAWAGYGWGARRFDEQRKATRTIADGTAALLGRLETGVEYMLIADIRRASSGEVVSKLTASVNGHPLVRAAINWPPTGHAEVIWIVPAALVERVAGQATFEFHLAIHSQSEFIEFHRVACQPRPW